MAQCQVTVDGEVLLQLFERDNGLAQLAEEMPNQIPEDQASE